MIESNLGLAPHQLGSGTVVMVCAVLSYEPTFQEFPVIGIFSSQPLLNRSGVAIAGAGSSGRNSRCQSAYGVPKVTFTSWSSAPRVTAEIWSYPLLSATR